MQSLKMGIVEIQKIKIQRLKMLEDKTELKNLTCPNCKGNSISVYCKELNEFVNYIPYCTNCHYSFNSHILLSERLKK
jgi:transposase-like protein